MNITQEKNADKLTLFIEGRIDTQTAPKLEEALGQSLDGVAKLIIDLKQTSYVSSAGLRVLLTAQKRMNKQGSLTVTNANEDLMEIFEVTGFTDILTIR